MSLKKKTVTATKWFASFAVVQQAFDFVLTVILARLLVPEDFGLMAIVATVVGIVRMFQDAGLGPALVQRKDLKEENVNAVFWGMLTFGAFLFLFFCFIAPLAAGFYESSRLVPLIIVCSLGFVLSPFYLVHQRLLERKMDFKSLGKVSISVDILSGFIAVCLALAGWGVWSLVFRMLLIHIFTPFMIWRCVEWRPCFQFRWEQCKEFLDFGFKLSADKVVSHMRQNVVFLIVGKVLGTYSLGVYRIGHRLIFQPLLNISTLFLRTLLSSYSKAQDDNDRLARGYLMTLHYLGLFIFPIAGGIMVTAPDIVHVVLGEKWTEAIPITQFLCLVGVMNVVINVGTAICYAKGRPDVSLKCNMMALVVYVPVIIFASRFGITAVAASIAFVSVPLFVVIQSFINNLMELTWHRLLKNLQQPLLLSVIMAFLVFIARFRFLQLSFNRLQILISEILIGIICYILLNFLLNRDSGIQAWRMILNRYE